jgi:hypothetical protein
VQAGLHALALPFYHHEFVRRAVLTACEEPLASAALLTLLKTLISTRDLSASQVRALSKLSLLFHSRPIRCSRCSRWGWA